MKKKPLTTLAETSTKSSASKTDNSTNALVTESLATGMAASCSIGAAETTENQATNGASVEPASTGTTKSATLEITEPATLTSAFTTAETTDRTPIGPTGSTPTQITGMSSPSNSKGCSPTETTRTPSSDTPGSATTKDKTIATLETTVQFATETSVTASTGATHTGTLESQESATAIKPTEPAPLVTMESTPEAVTGRTAVETLGHDQIKSTEALPLDITGSTTSVIVMSEAIKTTSIKASMSTTVETTPAKTGATACSVTETIGPSVTLDIRPYLSGSTSSTAAISTGNSSVDDTRPTVAGIEPAGEMTPNPITGKVTLTDQSPISPSKMSPKLIKISDTEAVTGAVTSVSIDCVGEGLNRRDPECCKTSEAGMGTFFFSRACQDGQDQSQPQRFNMNSTSVTEMTINENLTTCMENLTAKDHASEVAGLERRVEGSHAASTNDLNIQTSILMEHCIEGSVSGRQMAASLSTKREDSHLSLDSEAISSITSNPGLKSFLLNCREIQGQMNETPFKVPDAPINKNHQIVTSASQISDTMVPGDTMDKLGPDTAVSVPTSSLIDPPAPDLSPSIRS